MGLPLVDAQVEVAGRLRGPVEFIARQLTVDLAEGIAASTASRTCGTMCSGARG